MAKELTPTTIKRPLGVWLVVCFFGLSFLVVIPSTIYAINNQPQIFSQFSSFEIAMSVLAVAANCTAVILLFYLRALAFWIFLGVTFVSVVYWAVILLTGQEIPAAENMGMGGKIIEIIFWGAVLIYTWNLKKNGILK